MALTVRRAERDDAAAVAAFTRDTWPDRDGADYLPDVFEEWVATDGASQRTLVATADGTPVGVVQAVLLSDYEAWVQGMRVDPDRRGRGVGLRLARAAFDWARERGAVVARNLVFSWNAAGLGHARAAGFAPVAEFRWAHPTPDPDAAPDAAVTAEPAAAWHYWQHSDARAALAGLALDLDESWALADLTRERLARAADETRLVVVRDGGTRGFAYRTRAFDRESDGAVERWAEYGAAAWDDLEAARSVLAAVSRDAAAVGADRVRVLLPETPAAVSDAAAAGLRFADGPDFVLAVDLTDRA